MFRRIDGLVWDVVSGSVGLQTENGIYTVSLSADNTPQLNVNPLDDFGVALPAFATQATFDEVQPLDIIVGDSGIIGWVLEKNTASFKVLDHNGHQKTYVPPKVSILGTSGVLVVRNLMSLTGGAANANNFTSMLLPLLALGGGDNLEKLLPLLLLSSQGGAAGATGVAGAAPAAGGFNPLMLLLLKDGGLGGSGGSMDKLLPLMMMGGMGGMGGGAGGMNPLMMMALFGDGDFLGTSAKKSAVKPIPAVAPLVSTGVPTLNRL